MVPVQKGWLLFEMSSWMTGTCSPSISRFWFDVMVERESHSSPVAVSTNRTLW